MSAAARASVRRGTRQRGFTLIELAIVLAVIVILSAAIVPNMVQKARDALAQQTIEEMVHIQDAAKAFYLQQAADPTLATWPGQANTAVCAANPGGAAGQLVGGGFLAATELTNPWGQPYVVSPSGPSGNACGFDVATTVPDVFGGFFEAYLPRGQCGGAVCGVAAGANQVACCTSINKPGMERMLREFVPQTSERICENGLGGTYAFDQVGGPTCQLPAAQERWDVVDVPLGGNCPMGYRAVGARCGKRCSIGRGSVISCARVSFSGEGP